MKRMVGIDYGSERIGVAVSDLECRFAFPHSIIKNTSGVLDLLIELVKETGADTVVMGLSLDYQGRENPLMERAHSFAEELARRSGCSIVFENETLTSQQARRPFEQKEKTRKPQKREVVDASAAALILQQFIDKTTS